ncbi:hypothetical protein OCS_03138 [Ophiocordyceps sinensis CO18]|uniref:Uncharacterized protein n=1 Tax=Ophiocordyceps sinensis (strain Co18 / CGMCC 3.14243) TaxID=911162 RepID=T5AH56_OPHSC|nr:hypothetical protein OCS_03138 [Ophiocordyceps sinensis CO18]
MVNMQALVAKGRQLHQSIRAAVEAATDSHGVHSVVTPVFSAHYSSTTSEPKLPGIDLNRYGQYFHDLEQPANQYLSIETFGVPKNRGGNVPSITTSMEMAPVFSVWRMQVIPRNHPDIAAACYTHAEDAVTQAPYQV